MRVIAKILAVCFMLLLTVSYIPAVDAATAIISWDAPTTNEDGTPLTDLAGYKLYRGLSSGIYLPAVDVGNVRTYTISSLSERVYFFAVTAYDTSGNESRYSNEVSKSIHVAPAPPTGCAVQ